MKRQCQRAKWKFAIGTTSLVPDTSLHYLILDVDNDQTEPTLRYLTDVLHVTDLAAYPTPHGWHIYTAYKLSFLLLIQCISNVPNVDTQWLAIGRKRGYMFLADYKPVILPWPVVRMVLNHGKR
jgi:hypothetical protein